MAEFDLRPAEGATVLAVTGLMTHSDSGVFRVMLEKAAADAAPRGLIVDLTGLEFICSTGMSLLVHYQRALEEDGRRMVTTGLSGTVRETVEICGIDRLLSTAPTVDAALQSFRGH